MPVKEDKETFLDQYLAMKAEVARQEATIKELTHKLNRLYSFISNELGFKVP